MEPFCIKVLKQIALLLLATLTLTQLAEPCEACQATPSKPAVEFVDRDNPSVTKVILYSVGVGHIAHTGDIDGPVRFKVPFSSEYVDDSLKSLIFSDSGGGFVRSIEYRTALNEEDLAAETLGQPMTLSQLFQSLRGETLIAEFKERRVEGSIIGVENRHVGDSLEEVIVLLTDYGIESISLTAADRFQFAKVELQAQLRQALSGVAKQRDAVEKNLDLLFEGTGKRRVGFGYVIDVPVWRLTYRMEIENDKATLQGWAHVDNTSGVDWNDIGLELRSGRPFAIHADLFEPIGTRRIDASQSIFGIGSDGEVFRPSSESKIPGFRGIDKPMGRGGFGGGSGGGFGGGGQGGGAFDGSSDSDEMQNVLEESDDDKPAFQVGAGLGKAGQLVNFKLEKPVTIPSGSSAALPVFNREFKIRKVNRYVLGQSSVHPVRSLEWENSMDVPLIAGPVAIFQDRGFVGDAGLNRVESGELASIDYGIDQSTSVDGSQLAPREILTSITIRDGKFETAHRIESEFEFTIDNQDTESNAITVLVAAQEGSRFLGIQPTKTADETASFSFEVAAQSGHVLTIISASDKTESVPSLTMAVMQGWLAKPSELDPAMKGALLAAIQLDAEIIKLNNRISSELRSKKTEWIQIQTRARDNYQAIQGREPEQAKPFLNRILEAEAEVAEIDKSSKELEAKVAEFKEKRNLVFAPFETTMK